MFINKDRPNFETVAVIVVFVQLAAFILAMVPTEIVLNKNFTKDGERKNKDEYYEVEDEEDEDDEM